MRPKALIAMFAMLLSVFIAGGYASAEEAPTVHRAIPELASNEQMFEWTREIVDITVKHEQFRRFGTPGDLEVREYIVDKLKSFGLDSVEMQEYPCTYRHNESWELRVDGEEIPSFFMNGASFTDEEGVQGELVYVGEDVPTGVDYTGKIVVFELRGQSLPGELIHLASDFLHDPDGKLAGGMSIGGRAGPIPANNPIPYYNAAAQGAVAMIAILKDLHTGTDRFFSDPSGMVMDRMPAHLIGKYVGEELVREIEASREPLIASLATIGEIREGTSANIVVTLKGEKPEVILVNTHHDAGFAGATQDAAGVAGIMGLAQYFSKVPANFRQKTMVFVFDGSHFDWNYPHGANQFARMNPKVMKNVVLTFGYEHIALKADATKEGYEVSSDVEPRFLFVPRNKVLFEAARSAVVRNNVHELAILNNGAIPFFGETQSYMLMGYPSFSLISGPEYLFLADDTLDKVAKDEFGPTTQLFIDIINVGMNMPRAWLELVDKL